MVSAKMSCFSFEEYFFFVESGRFHSHHFSFEELGDFFQEVLDQKGEEEGKFILPDSIMEQVQLFFSKKELLNLHRDFDSCRRLAAKLRSLLMNSKLRFTEDKVCFIIDNILEIFWEFLRGEEIKKLSKELEDALVSADTVDDHHLQNFWILHVRKKYLSYIFYMTNFEDLLRNLAEKGEAVDAAKKSAFKKLEKKYKLEAKLEAEKKQERQLIKGCFDNEDAAETVLANMGMTDSVFVKILAERASHHGLSFRNYVTGENFPRDFGEKIFKRKDFQTTTKNFLMHVSADCRSDASKDACKRCRFENLQSEECECGCDCEEYEGDSDACKHHAHSSNDYTHHKCSLCKFVQCVN